MKNHQKKRRTVAECEIEIAQLRMRLARSIRLQRRGLAELNDESKTHPARVGAARSNISWALGYALDGNGYNDRWRKTRPAYKAMFAILDTM